MFRNHWLHELIPFFSECGSFLLGVVTMELIAGFDLGVSTENLTDGKSLKISQNG